MSLIIFVSVRNLRSNDQLTSLVSGINEAFKGHGIPEQCFVSAGARPEHVPHCPVSCSGLSKYTTGKCHQFMAERQRQQVHAFEIRGHRR